MIFIQCEYLSVGKHFQMIHSGMIMMKETGQKFWHLHEIEPQMISVGDM